MVDDFEAAIQAFWTGRDLQTQKQIAAGKQDAGTRGAVTGEGHLDPLLDAFAKRFRNSPIGDGLTIWKNTRIPLPGYYRVSKNWDLVVQHGDILVAAIELKSQVGSFGNNFNNRTAEAIGNSVDILRAHRGATLGPLQPWLGFVMVIEEAEKSVKTMSSPKALYKCDPVFDQSSYLDRYQILFQRLIAERLYDAAALIPTSRSGHPKYEVGIELRLQSFLAAIAGRITQIQGLGL